MNLETRLEQRLWEAVRASAEARQFSNAVLDAIHFLSDVIRDRAGLEGDGVALVGQAFGGTNPKLKVNKLQTESEQNVQRGIEALFRGIYQAVRNPRSHGATQDDERNATAILLFLDYLLRIVDQSKSPFSLPAFVGRVLDSGFVPSDRYAMLLIDEIPETRRLQVCLDVYGRRSEGDASRLKYFFANVLPKLTLEERSDLSHVIAEDLRQTDDENLIRFVLAALPPSFWPELTEIARLRSEHKLIEAIRIGRFDEQTGRNLAGGFGTWAIRILNQFQMSTELWKVIATKLQSDDAHEQAYALKWFAPKADQYLETPPYSLTDAVIKGLGQNDHRFKELVDGWALSPYEFGQLRPETDPWRKPFVKALAEFELVPEGAVLLADDDIPF